MESGVAAPVGDWKSASLSVARPGVDVPPEVPPEVPPDVPVPSPISDVCPEQPSAIAAVAAANACIMQVSLAFMGSLFRARPVQRRCRARIPANARAAIHDAPISGAILARRAPVV